MRRSWPRRWMRRRRPRRPGRRLAKAACPRSPTRCPRRTPRRARCRPRTGFRRRPRRPPPPYAVPPPEVNFSVTHSIAQPVDATVFPSVFAVVAETTWSATEKYWVDPECWVDFRVTPPVHGVGEPPPFPEISIPMTHSDACASAGVGPTDGAVDVAVELMDTSSAFAVRTPEQPSATMLHVLVVPVWLTVTVSDVVIAVQFSATYAQTCRPLTVTALNPDCV